MDTSVERRLVGTLINNGYLVRQCLQRLDASDFQDEFCDEIYRIIHSQYESGIEIDENTILYATEIPIDEIEFESLVAHNDPDNITNYINAVAKKSAQKKLTRIFGANEIGSDVQSYINKQVDRLRTIAQSLDGEGNPILIGKDLGNLFRETLAKRAAKDDSIKRPTGIQEIDEMTNGGLDNGWLAIIGARPSMGKTTLALNILENAVRVDNKRSMIFSMEMPGDELADKLISSIGRISLSNIKSGTLSAIERQRLPTVLRELESLNFVADDTPTLSLDQIILKAKKEHAKDPLYLIVIDYLGLITVEGAKDDQDKLAKITIGLKKLAKELKLPIILLAQLNREIEKRADKRPVMSDLRGSGQIEQDADLIVFTYRDFIYTKDPLSKDICEVITGKFRHGEPRNFTAKFEGKFSRFSSMNNTCYNDSTTNESTHIGVDFDPGL